METRLEFTTREHAEAVAAFEQLRERRNTIQGEREALRESLTASQALASVDDVAAMLAKLPAYERILADIGREIVTAAAVAERKNQDKIHAENQASEALIRQTVRGGRY